MQFGVLLNRMLVDVIIFNVRILFIQIFFMILERIVPMFLGCSFSLFIVFVSLFLNLSLILVSSRLRKLILS